MKKIFLMAALTVAMLFAATAAQAQTAPRTRPLPPFGGLPGTGWMSVNKRGLCIDGEPVSAKQAKSYARPYREAMKQLRRGQGWETGALFLAGAGGAAIGMDIGEAIGGEKISGTGIAAGLLFIGAGVGLEFIAISHYRKAAAAYNSATGLAELPRRDVTLALVPAGGGLGLRLTF